MKKILILLLALLLAAGSLVGCGAKKDNNSSEELAAAMEALAEAEKLLEEAKTFQEGNTSSAEANLQQDNHMFITIKESPDKYTWYIKNYVGRNCAAFGDSYYDEYRYDDYGEARVKFIFIADDNSFLNPEDRESLQNYIVTAQSVAPNTELKITFKKNDAGEEYDSLIEKQSIEEIELYVKRIVD